MLTLPKLSDLLNYENTAVIEQYCHDFPEKSPDEAQQIFRDLLGWMWLSIYRKQNNLSTHLFGPLLDLEAMWHVLILHTRDYIAFCHQYFLGYFHHEVEPVGQEYSLSAEELSHFLNDCYDHLGEDWILRNFGSLIEE